MHRSTWHRMALTTALSAVVLSGILLYTPPAHAHVRSAGVDMNVTLSVYTCCGALQGFNDNNPNHVWSMGYLYSQLWHKVWPQLKWKETLINDPATLETKLTLAVNAGDPPDIVFIQGGYAGYTVLRRLVQPLDQYFKQYHITANYFLPAMVRWAHFGGHWWAIPAVSGPLAGQLMYVPKFMSPLGYNNSDLRTFAQLYQMSKKAVRFDKAGNLVRIGYWPGVSASSPGMCPVGRGLYNTKTDQPTPTNPCNVAWLSYLKKLVDLYGGYKKLTKFLSGDPAIWSGSPKAYVATGMALIPPDDMAYWVIPELDTANYGVKGGLTYQLTPLPPTLHGTLAEAASYPATQQEVMIPRGAQHPAQAFAAMKMMCWDYGYILAPTGNGDVVATAQERWLQRFFVGEAARRQHNGMSGNPSVQLRGMYLQPQLARNSKAWNAINPVDIYYREQLSKYSDQVLYGQMAPQAALAQVQRLVVAQEQRLKGQYGAWNW